MKPHLRITVETLLRQGRGQREIERLIWIDRKTIRRIAREGQEPSEAKSPGVATGSDGRETAISGDENPPPWPPAPVPKEARSACEEHRAWIQDQVELGRNAQSIFQDLVQGFGFTHRYNSVKGFVRALKRREPDRFDVLESPIGEEAQVDFGKGAPTLYHNGKHRRPWLFCMTLKYSGKAFRKVVWKADQQTWARLHEEAFRAFGGSVQYVVLDNLKQGVISPDLYEPQYNPVYTALLSHYNAAADAARSSRRGGLWQATPIPRKSQSVRRQ